MKKFVAILMVLAFGFLTSAQENSLLWKVHGPDGQISYLFGTYHLMGSEFLKEKQGVMEAYNSSQKVIVETVIDSNLLGEVAMLSFMPGQSLKALVDSAEYELIREKMEPILNVPLSAVDQLKPMALSMAYTTQMAQEATPSDLAYDGDPLDIYFADQAEQRGVEVLALETMLEQTKLLLNHDPLQKQADDLVELLQDDSGAFTDSKDLVNAYVNEDLAEMARLADDYEMQSGEMDYLVAERNRNWLPKLTAAFEEGTCFVAVGALHLIGKDGLISLLEEQGYRLEALR